jgi:coatomer subunit beta'
LDKSQRNSEWEQIKVCTEIGIRCIDSDPANRPDSMKDIMDRLVEMENEHVIPVAAGQRKLLDVHPPVLYFQFESNKVIPCSLHLTNNTNEQVAFRLMDRSDNSWPCFVRLPLCGLVPPRSTYTLVLTTEERNELERRNICMILKITILGDEHIDKFQSDTFFEDVKAMGNEVQEVKLLGVHTTGQEIMPSKVRVTAF